MSRLPRWNTRYRENHCRHRDPDLYDRIEEALLMDENFHQHKVIQYTEFYISNGKVAIRLFDLSSNAGRWGCEIEYRRRTSGVGHQIYHRLEHILEHLYPEEQAIMLFHIDILP
jgi:hypothetical protein